MADLFQESELSRADLKNLINLALQRVECDLYLAQFVWWVFNVETRDKPLKKSYDELARRGMGLCCSRNKAYGTVKTAKRLGFVKVAETWAGPGIQGANEYRLDVAGIRQIVVGRQVAGYPTGRDAYPTTGDPDTTTGDPDTTTGDLYKEDTFSLLLAPSCSSSSSVATRAEEEAATADASWSETRLRLLTSGVYAETIDRLLAALASRGGSQRDAAGLVDHFEAHRSDFGAGALANALKHWQPGQPYDAAGIWPIATMSKEPAGKWSL